jgi:hypothetical protein
MTVELHRQISLIRQFHQIIQRNFIPTVTEDDVEVAVPMERQQAVVVEHPAGAYPACRFSRAQTERAQEN